MAEEDIIYGKNRHFFGGIEPSNMVNFTISKSDTGLLINAELPNDTIVDGQTLCTVAGAIIRRSTLDYPKDEFDGELVANITKSATVADAIDPDLPYYYAAFPYTTQGVYNRNPANRVSINIPSAMTKFTARSTYDYTDNSCAIELTAVLPDDAVGAIIRRSETAYPVNETDGEECMNVTSTGKYTDENVELGKVYYYSAFPYSVGGGYNRDPSNFISIIGAKYQYLFGFDLDTTDPNPDTRVTYPEDVNNTKYTPAKMNFTTSKFEYNDWNIKPGEMFMPRPCMLKYDGTVDHYLDPTDYTLQDDGVTPSKVSDTSFAAQAMIEWPKIFTYREQVDGVYKFRCSDTPQGEGWDCWCNYDKDDNQIDHFYTSIYCITSYWSKSGQSYIKTDPNSAGNSLSYYRNSITTMGDFWTLGVLADHLLIQDLLILMSKTTNAQAAFGYGKYNNGGTKNPDYSSGTMNDKGLFWGGSSYDNGVKVFGMEHYWGNELRHVEGWMMGGNTSNVYRDQYVKITRGTHDGTTVNYYTVNMDEMIMVSDGSQLTNNSAYIAKMAVRAYGRIPLLTPVSGSGSNTYECDQINCTSSSTKNNPVGVGGSTSYTKEANGPFFANGITTGMYMTLSCKPSQTL